MCAKFLLLNKNKCGATMKIVVIRIPQHLLIVFFGSVQIHRNILTKLLYCRYGK